MLLCGLWQRHTVHGTPHTQIGAEISFLRRCSWCTVQKMLSERQSVVLREAFHGDCRTAGDIVLRKTSGARRARMIPGRVLVCMRICSFRRSLRWSTLGAGSRISNTRSRYLQNFVVLPDSLCSILSGERSSSPSDNSFRARSRNHGAQEGICIRERRRRFVRVCDFSSQPEIDQFHPPVQARRIHRTLHGRCRRSSHALVFTLGV